MIQAQSAPTGVPIRYDLAQASARGWLAQLNVPCWGPGSAECALPPIARFLSKPTNDCPVPTMDVVEHPGQCHDVHHAGRSQVFPPHARPTIGHANRLQPCSALGIDPCIGKANFVGQQHKSRPSRCILQHPFDRGAPSDADTRSVATFCRGARFHCPRHRGTTWGPLLFTRRDNLRQTINP